jgi:hypothetical protein
VKLSQLIKRAKEYVELEAEAKVTGVKFEQEFELFGSKDVVLSVRTKDKKYPEWWVVGGGSPMNLYDKKKFNTADEAFSFHSGLMARIMDRQFKSSKKRPKDIGYDLFISHASEDKENLVRPVAEQLKKMGVSVWYDEFEIKVGDSLRRSIDKGLVSSRMGAVILSKAFFKKEWTAYELDGLTAKKIAGRNRILPVWFGIDKKYLLKKSPALADVMAIAANGLSPKDVAKKLASALK